MSKSEKMELQQDYWPGLLKRRIINSGQNSFAGLHSCFRHEEAFRIEVMLGLILTPFAWWLADSTLELLLLITPIFLVLITELLNSAIEATVDRVGLDYHDLSKRAKDIGSAAVFISMAFFLIIWTTIIIT